MNTTTTLAPHSNHLHAGIATPRHAGTSEPELGLARKALGVFLALPLWFVSNYGEHLLLSYWNGPICISRRR